MQKQKLGPQPLLYPLPVVLVGAHVNGRANFQAVSWCGIVSFSPPILAIGLAPERYTLQGLRENGTFSVNVACTDMVADVDYCGIKSGRDVDKSQLFQVFHGVLETAPLIGECPINLECKVLESRNVGSHVLVLGEIVETHVSSACMTDGRPDMEKIKPLLFSIGSMAYHGAGCEIGKAYQLGKR
jgi:flavin reductase (DIM6/NTAB) family NADH-FMN oxidoreductase RutF